MFYQMVGKTAAKSGGVKSFLNLEKVFQQDEEFLEKGGRPLAQLVVGQVTPGVIRTASRRGGPVFETLIAGKELETPLFFHHYGCFVQSDDAQFRGIILEDLPSRRRVEYPLNPGGGVPRPGAAGEASANHLLRLKLKDVDLMTLRVRQTMTYPCRNYSPLTIITAKNNERIRVRLKTNLADRKSGKTWIKKSSLSHLQEINLSDCTSFVASNYLTALVQQVDCMAGQNEFKQTHQYNRDQTPNTSKPTGRSKRHSMRSKVSKVDHEKAQTTWPLARQLARWARRCKSSSTRQKKTRKPWSGVNRGAPCLERFGNAER
ncbi:hypothetical protein BC830DRAFT_1084553 [Chytriomyces sp. MP71]|nr:hypothetical protein BC830DRAFT_1084553 [Chytriomyces sp. MP71]